MKEIKITKEIEQEVYMEKFIIKIEKLSNPELIQKLKDLYLIDSEEAWRQYRLAFAKQVVKDKNNLFKRLSDL